MIARFMILIAALSLSVHAADTYSLDPAHSRIGFTVQHLQLVDIYGSFTDYTSTLKLDGDKLQGATMTIQTKSIDTGVENRDNHLRNEDFFDVEKYPTITFTAESVEMDEDKQVLVGTFTMHGVSKQVRLPLTVKGPITDPWGKVRIGISGSLTIDRTEYGIDYHKMVPGVGAMVSNDVVIQIDAEAVKQ